MNLAIAFAQSALKHSSKTALFWGDRTYSYSELFSMAQSFGRQLIQLGVRPGDRVGLWLKNCPEYIPALFGVFHIGAVAVPINNFLKVEEVSFIISDAEIDVLITDPELCQSHRELESSRPRLKLVLADTCPPCEATEFPLPATTENDLAVLIYTSGTTGHPKGAMLSHGNLLHNVESCRVVLQAVEGDRIAVLLPMFHSYMLTVGMLLPTLVGGSVVLIKSLHPIRNALMEIIQHQTSILPSIPQFYRSLASAPFDIKLPVRIFISGAAPLPAQVLLDFEAKFKAPLIEGYGLSEASPVVTKNPLNGARKPGSVGIPVANVEVSIQDEEGNTLEGEEIGEICVRGGNVMMGYWKKPEETARTIRNGWLLTGDVGYRDKDGYFYITDRKKDMLLVNGINVYPREIEEVIYQFPGVKEAAVIGKPDHRRGEQAIAFVAASDGVNLDEKELQSFIRKKLADYKVPRRVLLVPALPRNATGKVLKTALRQAPVDEGMGEKGSNVNQTD